MRAPDMAPRSTNNGHPAVEAVGWSCARSPSAIVVLDRSQPVAGLDCCVARLAQLAGSDCIPRTCRCLRVGHHIRRATCLPGQEEVLARDRAEGMVGQADPG